MISVIVPTLNEEAALGPLLAALGREPGVKEIIVVDGGSVDRTRSIAERSGACVLLAPPGRGGQLRLGARHAAGDVLWFLHADSTVHPAALRRIQSALAARPEVVGGNFRLLFDGETRFSRWLTGFYARIRWFGLYYGDSGIFVRREVYERLGGIRAIALMEDLDFVRRLERIGRTCCIADPPLVTSSRRFAGRRPVAIVCGWIRLHILFWLGVSPDRLVAIYRRQAPPAARKAGPGGATP